MKLSTWQFWGRLNFLGAVWYIRSCARKTCHERTRSASFKLKEERFRLHIRQKFFTVRMLKH